jgi:hypothetical protein
MSESEIEIPSDLRNPMLDAIRAKGPIQEDGRSFLIEKQYPEIEDFKVSIFPNESKHPGRPHCQVRIAEMTAIFDIRTGDVLAGDIKRWERTVRKVLLDHQDGLLNFWHEMRPDDQKLP